MIYLKLPHNPTLALVERYRTDSHLDSILRLRYFLKTQLTPVLSTPPEICSGGVFFYLYLVGREANAILCRFSGHTERAKASAITQSS